MSVVGKITPSDLYITPELHRRVPKAADYLSEKVALQDIAAQMVDHPEQVLPKLVERAMQMTGAASAGISEYEPQEGTAGIFRWRDLKGELARFVGATTPRGHSPCGVCLDRFEPTLTRRPERHYEWIVEAGVSCPEVLLVPLYVAQGQPLGTLWIVAEREGYFDSGHARIMRELASFVGIALSMLQDKQRLQEAVKQQKMLTAEMGHRIKNLFSIVDAMIRMSKRSSASAADLATILSGRLHALAAANALVRPNFSLDPKQDPPTASLTEVITAILKPYEAVGVERFVISGQEVDLDSQSTTSLALVFHEMATNAAKYGAFARDTGQVSVSWAYERANLRIRWRERGGPEITTKPPGQGFGSTLTRATLMQLSGTLALDWQPQGLTVDLEIPLAKLSG